MPEYDLMVGLTALAAYGVLLIANNELVKSGCKYIRGSENVTNAIALFFAHNLLFAGVTILTTTVIRIVLNSSLQILITEKGTEYVRIGLLFPILIPQIWFFWEAITKVLKREEVNAKFVAIVVIIYGSLVSSLTKQNFNKYILPYLLYSLILPSLIRPIYVVLEKLSSKMTSSKHKRVKVDR